MGPWILGQRIIDEVRHLRDAPSEGCSYGRWPFPFDICASAGFAENRRVTGTGLLSLVRDLARDERAHGSQNTSLAGLGAVRFPADTGSLKTTTASMLAPRATVHAECGDPSHG